MKIAHVSAAMAHGGAERVLLDLACSQAQTGIEVAIIAPAGNLDRDWAAAGIERILIPTSRRRSLQVLRMVTAIRSALACAAPDVVHAHNVKATGTVLAARAVGRGAPVLTTMHGVEANDLAWSARILRFTDMTVAVSDAVRDDIVARGLPPERVRVIRNGIGPAPTVDARRRRAYASELGLGRRVVTAVGRLAPQKAHARLLDAAALVLRDHPDTTFLLVGDGPLGGELRAQAAQLGIAGSIRFAGARDDARALIALSDLVVFSSDWEGLSIAALESLASGIPLVTTDVAGMRELLSTGAGSIARGWEPADLAAEISCLLADDARRGEMGRIGRQVIEAEFSAAPMRTAYLDAYGALLNVGQR